METKTGLILALDVIDMERAAKVAQATAAHVDAIKVHWPIILSEGLRGIRGLSKLHPIIVDMKLSDIPHTNRIACDMLFSSGATGVICQGFAGRDSVKSCIEAGGEVYVLVEMSHPGSREFITPHSKEMAELARDIGADGIIAPGNRPKRLSIYRKIIGQDMKILCPGIGAQGGEPGDAVANGADFEIVGRAIYRSDDPGRAAARIAEAISEKRSRP
jgi:orotidine-5'-phosphate decarboxylase